MTSDPLDALDVAPVEHLRGCPAATHELGDEGSRVERFRVELGGRTFDVTRCCDCGQQAEEEVVDGG